MYISLAWVKVDFFILQSILYRHEITFYVSDQFFGDDLRYHWTLNGVAFNPSGSRIGMKTGVGTLLFQRLVFCI